MPPETHTQLPPDEILNKLLNAEDIPATLGCFINDLDLTLVVLIRQQIFQAQAEGEMDLAEGLQVLVEMIEKLADERDIERNFGIAVATLTEMIQSEDIIRTIKGNPEIITRDLADLIWLNARVARREGQNFLADNIEAFGLKIFECKPTGL